MPGVKYLETSQASYVPTRTTAVAGVIGPASKGPINRLIGFSDSGNFNSAFGRPVNRQYAVRAGMRYLEKGSQLQFVRIAGSDLATASCSSRKSISGTVVDLLKFTAISPGTWANGKLTIIILHNGNPAISYNIYLYFDNHLVERYEDLVNGNVENTLNNNSNYVKVKLHASAGTTMPDETVDSATEQQVPLVMANGNDGAFASSKNSSTGGFGAKSSFAYSIAANATKDYSGTENRVIAPKTFSVTDTVETFTDNGFGVLTGSGTGTGVIDYATGIWSLSFFVIPTNPVAVSYNAGTYEVLGSFGSTTTAYSGTISRKGVYPGTMLLLSRRYDQLAIGNGTEDTYALALSPNMKPGSLVITAVDVLGNEMTVTDDGEGVLTGDATGTIVYSTGIGSVVFAANVRNNNVIHAKYSAMLSEVGGVITGANGVGTISYKTGAWAVVFTLTTVGNYVPAFEDAAPIEVYFKHTTILAIGDGVLQEFSGTLDEFPVKKGSVLVTYAVGSVLTDVGDGTLTGAGGDGTIDYVTGEIEISLSGPVASLYNIRVDSEPVVLQSICKYCGDIGNERSVLENGLFVQIDKATTQPVEPASFWYRLRVMFNNGTTTSAVETFDNAISIDDLVSLVNDDENGSDFITLMKTDVPNEGNVDSTGQKIGMAGAFTSADVIGTHVGPTYTGMQLFSNKEAVPLNILTAPGIWDRRVANKGIELSVNRRTIWLFSSPDFSNIEDAKNFVNGSYNSLSPGGIARPTALIPYPPLSSVNTDEAFSIFTWVYYTDAFTGEEVREPGEGEILKLMANTAVLYGTHQPISGLNRGRLEGVTSLVYSPEEKERNNAYGLVGSTYQVINSFVNFLNQGIFLYGERTMVRKEQATAALHNRWTANIIANEIEDGGKFFVFELNDDSLWRRISADVNRKLQHYAAKGAVSSYSVVCDGTTAQPKKAVCKFTITFPESAEEIEFQATYISGSASVASANQPA